MEIKLHLLGMLFAPLLIPVTGWVLECAARRLRTSAGEAIIRPIPLASKYGEGFLTR